MDMETLILDRIDAIDKKLDGLKSNVLQRVTELETRVEPLFDNGQPGRCSYHDARIRVIEDIEAERKGWVMSRKALVATAMSIILVLGGLVTAGANVYGSLHQQSQAIQAQIIEADGHAQARQTAYDAQIQDLQEQVDDVHSLAASQRRDISKNVKQVGSQVNQLTQDVNAPKKHWYK
jgi:hypothetical protein